MLTAREIAEWVGGQLVGNPGEVVAGVAGIREAQPGDITFAGHPKYFPALRATRATVALVPRDASLETALTLIRVDNPSAAFTRVVARLAPPPVSFAPGVHPTAQIAADVRLGAAVSIQPHVVIEPGAVIGERTVLGAGVYVGHGCQIGAGCLLYPRVVLRERTRLGQQVILHAGVVLGADGFGFETIHGEHQKIPQVGTVEIGDHVEIGANSCVDRGRFGVTRIGAGTKIDNLVQIGHNCVIGERCIVCAGCGIAGSVIIGRNVTLAGQVGIAGHLTIGDGAIIGAQAGVAQDVPAGAVVLGAPAVDHRQFKRNHVALQRLPELAQRLRALEKELAARQSARPGS